MTDKDILQMLVSKLEQVALRIQDDYNKGKITADVKNHSLFYNDLTKYDIQKLLNTLTHN